MTTESSHADDSSGELNQSPAISVSSVPGTTSVNTLLTSANSAEIQISANSTGAAAIDSNLLATPEIGTSTIPPIPCPTDQSDYQSTRSDNTLLHSEVPLEAQTNSQVSYYETQRLQISSENTMDIMIPEMQGLKSYESGVTLLSLTHYI